MAEKLPTIITDVPVKFEHKHHILNVEVKFGARRSGRTTALIEDFLLFEGDALYVCIHETERRRVRRIITNHQHYYPNLELNIYREAKKRAEVVYYVAHGDYSHQLGMGRIYPYSRIYVDNLDHILKDMFHCNQLITTMELDQFTRKAV